MVVKGYNEKGERLLWIGVPSVPFTFSHPVLLSNSISCCLGSNKWISPLLLGLQGWQKAVRLIQWQSISFGFFHLLISSLSPELRTAQTTGKKKGNARTAPIPPKKPNKFRLWKGRKEKEKGNRRFANSTVLRAPKKEKVPKMREGTPKRGKIKRRTVCRKREKWKVKSI